VHIAARPAALLAPTLLAASLLAACSAPAVHVPPFARVPYEPISRDAVTTIALREWRLFGSPVDDDPPGSYRPASAADKPERQQGLWQRVGEYWWLGLNAGAPEAAWTGRHDANGAVFPATEDATYAWSAAFVSYVLRMAGAGERFPYSATHSDYINRAKDVALGHGTRWIVSAERVTGYAPRPGDLICRSRDGAPPPAYDDLPLGRFASHCDIVVMAQPGQLTVVGGNVDDAVVMKHVPTTPEGLLARPDGTVVDPRYSWFVVLRGLYDGSPGV